MKEFFKINSSRLFKDCRNFTIFLIVLFTLIIHLDQGINSINFFISISFLKLIVSTTLLSVFSITVTGIQEAIRNNSNLKLITKPPLINLLENGFHIEWIDRSEYSSYTKKGIQGTWNHFNLTIEFEPRRITIIAHTNYDHLDDMTQKEISTIIKPFEQIKFEYFGDGIGTSILRKKLNKMTSVDLTIYLNEFTEMLNEFKLTPIKNT